jgi:hypothetical protein
MNFTIAWLAQGKLRLKTGDESPRTVDSVYGQTIRDRAVKSAQRNSWKRQGSGFFSGPALWGRGSTEDGTVPLHITGLCRGTAPGQFYYSLESGSLCGVLAVENLGAEERRLWNNNTIRLRNLSVSPDTGDIVCSVEQKMGAENIGVISVEGGGVREATEGDSMDLSPSWVPGSGRKVAFQSAGIGRNRDGHFAGLGPFVIQLVDLDNGEMSTLAKDSRHDLLAPRMTADGLLLYIRRPYRSGGETNFLKWLKDVLLFPFRLLAAIFGWLNIFSIFYGGKPLTSSSGPGQQMDLKKMVIYGNVISAEQARDDKDEAPDLVPKSWQLIRRSSSGEEEVLARGVLAYDLAPDGGIVYTNGNAIFVLGSDGKSRRVVTEMMIEQVVVLPAPAIAS